MLSKLQSTAPKRIWLQISDDENDHERPFPKSHEGITWCQDSVQDCEVEYVRADRLAQQGLHMKEARKMFKDMLDHHVFFDADAPAVEEEVRAFLAKTEDDKNEENHTKTIR